MEHPVSTPSATELATMDLREITEISETDGYALIERLSYEIETTDWSDEDKQLVFQALEDALRIHEGDTQGTRPFIVHPLRVAIRIMSKDHFNVRDRPDLIIAALLHDSVEDHPERWLPELGDVSDFKQSDYGQPAIYDLQQRALDAISERYDKADDPEFGKRIRGIVEWLTSEPYRDDLNKDVESPVERQLRKWDAYEYGVRELMQAPDALGAKVDKLSDFIENFVGGMRHHEEAAIRIRMARKYVFLSNDMYAFVKASKIIPQSSKRRLMRQIARAQTDALKAISSHVKLHLQDAPLYDISGKTIERLDGRKKVKPGKRLGLVALISSLRFGA